MADDTDQTRLPAQIRSDKLRRMHAYWVRIKGDKAMPARADFDPVDIPDLLANISLMDLSFEPFRATAKVVGTAIVEFLGRDHTGKSIEEGLEPALASEAMAQYRDVVDARQPVLVASMARVRDREHFEVERLLLPLSDDGETVNMCITCTEFTPAARSQGE